MVALYVAKIAQVVARAGSAEEAFRRLRSRCFLSLRALREKQRVVTLIQDTWDAFPDQPAPGREPASDVVSALRREGYIGIFGLTWGTRLEARLPGWSSTWPARRDRG